MMIRLAKPEDLDEAAEITKSAWLEMYERAGAMTQGTADYIHGAKSYEGLSNLRDWADSIIIVSVSGGILDGAAIASTFSIKGRARLVSLAVAQKSRKQGIGTALLSRVERELAGKKGVVELELNALARLHDVVAFYERRGYVRDERRPVDESVPTATVQLSKRIG